MVNEIIVAIDPFLAKVEDILLWKHKIKSCAVFIFCHILFWLFLNYNIRTYCTIASVLLTFHLLDMYRTKKRRDLIKLHKKNQNIAEAENESEELSAPRSPATPKSPSLINCISSTGKTIIYINNKCAVLYNKLNWLKKRNRFIYFLVMFTFWSMTAIIGTKIQGSLLLYICFWILFFVPAIIHFDIPRKLLCRALPLLEQLDHSMKYERRSILDKSDLLVDVQHKNSDETDQAEEDEYLKSFELGQLSKSKRRIIENLEDEESLFSERTDESEENSEMDDEEEEDEVVEEVFEVQTYGKNKDEQFQVTKMISSNKGSSRFPAPVKTSLVHLDVFDANNDSLLPDEFMPNVNMSAMNSFLSHTSNDDSFSFNNVNVDSGNKVLKKRATKVRPNVLDYYGGSSSSRSASQKTPQNERNIDETFDFLDEELNKYK